ncbi:PAS domain S-box-containing protein [Roseivivax lentus]|uniref:PAS domain S-box-containing protein n=2 Tax=Roseivivax lentus TaxID=633194 RepID=A0A1N7NI10_9RHOB|nr:PAS domain S-box-containing protein [Roseivivax lentus]
MAGFSRLSLAIVITNPQVPDNPIVYVNDAFERITGYARSSVIGRNCRFLQGERTRKTDVDRIRTAVENGREVSVDILNYRASGQPFLNRLTIAPILDEQGNPLYFLGFQKELREDEDESVSNDTILDLLLGRVHGDLGLILRNIAHPDIRENLTEPMTEIEAMPRRLDCIQLVYEEMQKADRELDRAGLDLGALLSRIAANVTHHESRPGIRVVQQFEQMEVGLDDALRIALILSETLSNAFSHAFVGLDSGFVDLRVTKLAAGGLRLILSDDGVGIPAKIDWPSNNTVGGRLIASLLDGLDATINVARGAAGTVVMVDVPVHPHDLAKKGA